MIKENKITLKNLVCALLFLVLGIILLTSREDIVGMVSKVIGIILIIFGIIILLEIFLLLFFNIIN